MTLRRCLAQTVKLATCGGCNQSRTASPSLAIIIFLSRKAAPSGAAPSTWARPNSLGAGSADPGRPPVGGFWPEHAERPHLRQPNVSTSFPPSPLRQTQRTSQKCNFTCDFTQGQRGHPLLQRGILSEAHQRPQGGTDALDRFARLMGTGTQRAMATNPCCSRTGAKRIAGNSSSARLRRQSEPNSATCSPS